MVADYRDMDGLPGQVADGEVLRWATVAQLTGDGTASGRGALLRQVGFTVRDVIRQEP